MDHPRQAAAGQDPRPAAAMSAGQGAPSVPGAGAEQALAVGSHRRRAPEGVRSCRPLAWPRAEGALASRDPRRPCPQDRPLAGQHPGACGLRSRRPRNSPALPGPPETGIRLCLRTPCHGSGAAPRSIRNAPGASETGTRRRWGRTRPRKCKRGAAGSPWHPKRPHGLISERSSSPSGGLRASAWLPPCLRRPRTPGRPPGSTGQDPAPGAPSRGHGSEA